MAIAMVTYRQPATRHQIDEMADETVLMVVACVVD
jgi:chromosome segregation and condensation protein ScpB